MTDRPGKDDERRVSVCRDEPGTSPRGLFDDPRVVEAAARTLLPTVGVPEDERECWRAESIVDARALLTAAVAALPRDELIEKAAHAIAGEAAIRCDVWHPVAAYRADAIAAFKAIGLIPEHITATEER